MPKIEFKFLSRAYEEINAHSILTEMSSKYIIHVTWCQLRCVILKLEWGEVVVTRIRRRQLLMCGVLVATQPKACYLSKCMQLAFFSVQ